jgi:thiol-disulfide isomerase/thioredoxin
MRALGIGLIALAMALAGFFAARLYFDEPLPASRLSRDGVIVGNTRPDFHIGSSTGEIVAAADFDGRVLLLNFWATWCEPCRREMPMLVNLQAQYGPAGLQVVGVAVDDPARAREFADTYDISYPILVGMTDVMEMNATYGNTDGVLPYSVLVDRDGIVRWQYVGEIPRRDVTTLLDRYL